MPRRPRFDGPGVMHHVMNRGAAKRSLFVDDTDRRAFLAAHAWAVRREQLLIVLYCLIRSHFHMLLTSRDGTLSHGMMRAQNAYVRHFNRRHQRDGSLPRGRFRSIPITSEAYWHTLVRYIDFNPVRAGLCTSPEEYAWGSARHYSSSLEGPLWLHREPVERYVLRFSGGASYQPAAYRAVFGGAPTLAERELVVRRRRSLHWSMQDDLDSLLAAPVDALRRWLEECARRADGRPAAIPRASALAVDEAVSEQAVELGPLPLRPARSAMDGWPVLRAGLLAALVGLPHEEVSRRLSVSASTAARHVRLYAGTLLASASFADLAAAVAQAALRKSLPAWSALQQGRVRAAPVPMLRG